jgi:hypothetical protein
LDSINWLVTLLFLGVGCNFLARFSEVNVAFGDGFFMNLSAGFFSGGIIFWILDKKFAKRQAEYEAEKSFIDKQRELDQRFERRESLIFSTSDNIRSNTIMAKRLAKRAARITDAKKQLETFYLIREMQN